MLLLKKRIRNAIYIFVLAAVFMTALSGCQLRDTTKRDNGNAAFKIVTSFYPIYIATLNVVQNVEGVQVVNMTQPQTGCLHDYQLKPKDLETLETADVFVVNGAGMEGFLDKVLAQRKDLFVVDASEGINDVIITNAAQNAHVWLDVDNEISQVNYIANGLAAALPENAARFLENAKVYIEKLKKLKAELVDGLKPFAGREIITFHEAFPYFAKEFGLKIAAVIEREPGVAPTPKELEQTIATVKKMRVGALFAEPQYSPKAAEVIARETGAKIYTLDPIVTGDANEDAFDDYLIKMRQNFETIKLALGGQ